jgi:hypothetical protein
MTYERVGQFLA